MGDAIEEGGKVAAGFIDAMKTQPLALALCAGNILLICLFYFILSVVAEQRRREVQLFYDEARSVREMLSSEHRAVMEMAAKCGAAKT
jgi:hypothetical protein